MAETPSKAPVKTGSKGHALRLAGELWRPMESLRREVDVCSRTLTEMSGGSLSAARAQCWSPFGGARKA